MKFFLSTKKIALEFYEDLPYNLKQVIIGPYHVLTENSGALNETSEYFYHIDGYMRNYDIPINNDIEQINTSVESVAQTWPVADNITGSFSTLIIHKKSFDIILCNDLIGVYPLYYLHNDNEFYVSNCIILLGILSNCEFDKIGIVQRCIGPEFSNIGTRTILKDGKRLLPGEYIKFNDKGVILNKTYDNSLYSSLSEPNQNHQIHKNFWKTFKKEVAFSLGSSQNVSIALSGGIDSRVVLGAIPKEKKITCFTFGESKNYETGIAKRLAKIKNAEFKSYSQPDLFFPRQEILKKYTLQTESLHLCSWLEVLENVSPDKKKPLLLGDLTTALTGRTIEKFSSKKFRQENFWKYYILNKDYGFNAPSDDALTQWKNAKIQSFELWYGANNISRLEVDITQEELSKGLHSDLNEIFNRIDSHKIPYIELYDEIFSWYTHTRMVISRQILICGISFKSFCPPMSIQILKLSSNIHPNLRLNFRFIKKLFNETKEIKNLFKVPTSQAPLVPQNYPDLIKFPIWGIRSKIDQYLIRRLMKEKNINKRYRLFSSMNWAKIYQNPAMENNIKDYFKNNHLGKGYFEYLLRQAQDRKELKQWPFANLEIINAANLNQEIQFIKTLRKKK